MISITYLFPNFNGLDIWMNLSLSSMKKDFNYLFIFWCQLSMIREYMYSQNMLGSDDEDLSLSMYTDT